MEEKVPKHSSHHSDSLDQSDFDMDTEIEEPAGMLTDLTPSAGDQTLSLAEFYQ